MIKQNPINYPPRKYTGNSDDTDFSDNKRFQNKMNYSSYLNCSSTHDSSLGSSLATMYSEMETTNEGNINRNARTFNNSNQFNRENQKSICIDTRPNNLIAFNYLKPTFYIFNQTIDSYKLANSEYYKLYNVQNIPKPFINNCDKEFKRIKKSKDELDATLFEVSIENIYKNLDRRTTLMIRNIPNKYTMKLLIPEMDSFLANMYDFFYLPLDFENNCNLGYGFINFIDPLYILMFFDKFKGRKWKRFNSNKACNLSYAKFQGKLELLSHLEKTCVMNKLDPEKKPVILHIKSNKDTKIRIPQKYLGEMRPFYSEEQLGRFSFVE